MTEPKAQAVELLPCPFCGDEAGPEISGDEFATADSTYTIFCNGCHASAATEHTYGEAVARWNTRAALASSPPTNAPSSDYVLVPREPTEEMMRAAWDASEDYFVSDAISKTGLQFALAAMLAAAPSPPQADHVERVARTHVMSGDPDDLGQIALQWYLGFNFGYPHTVRESNMAVEGFKDGYRAALNVSPPAVADPGEGE